MRKYWTVLLIMIFAAGCASASVPYFPSENQEEQIQKLLVGTWAGSISDSAWYRMKNGNVTLRIYEVRKEPNGWKVGAIINWKPLEYIELYVNRGTVRLKIMDRYGGLFTLDLYRNTHLVGNVIYDRGHWLADPHNVVLEKISR